MKYIKRGLPTVLSLSFLFVCGLLFYQVLETGAPGLTKDFFTSSVEDAGRKGGVFPVIINTVIVVGLASVITLVIGTPVGFYLSDSRTKSNKFKRWTSFSLDLLASTPSIVFGLVGHILFSRVLGFGYSLLSGALTLALMCLPFFIRITEDGLKILPIEYGQNADALGISSFNYFSSVILPLSIPIFSTAFTLSVGRGLAETAALIFTSGYATRMPESLLDSGRTLSVHIMDLAMNVSGGDKMAYASAALLLLVSFVFNISARVVMRCLHLKQQT